MTYVKLVNFENLQHGPIQDRHVSKVRKTPLALSDYGLMEMMPWSRWHGLCAQQHALSQYKVTSVECATIMIGHTLTKSYASIHEHDLSRWP